MIKPARRGKKIDYSGLSIKTLKVELAKCGVATDGFLEKAEFVKALEDTKRREKKSFSLSRKHKDQLSTASTHSTTSSRSGSSFSKPEKKKPKRQSTRRVSSEKNQRPSLRPARLEVIGVRPMKTVRRSSSVGSSGRRKSRSSATVGSENSGRRKSRSSSTKPSKTTSHPRPSPPPRASSFQTGLFTIQRREKRHTLRPSSQQGTNGKQQRTRIQRTASLPIQQQSQYYSQ